MNTEKDLRAMKKTSSNPIGKVSFPKSLGTPTHKQHSGWLKKGSSHSHSTRMRVKYGKVIYEHCTKTNT